MLDPLSVIINSSKMRTLCSICLTQNLAQSKCLSQVSYKEESPVCRVPNLGWMHCGDDLSHVWDRHSLARWSRHVIPCTEKPDVEEAGRSSDSSQDPLGYNLNQAIPGASILPPQ